jgi:uncharacterized tellurite resistance protein B-like protein
MDLRRFLGRPGPPQAASGSEADTQTVRRIIAELDAVPHDERRYLAGYAYILSRAAHADLDIADDESALIEQIVKDIGGLPPAQAVLVVEIARHQSQLYGGTEDYLVTRDFAGRATDEQRLSLLEACFAVVAVDHTITAEEYTEMTQIASELDISREQLNVIRRQYRDHLTAIQRMRGR